jgi:hypothetical protein
VNNNNNNNNNNNINRYSILFLEKFAKAANILDSEPNRTRSEWAWAPLRKSPELFSVTSEVTVRLEDRK